MVDNIPRMESIKTTSRLTGVSEDALRKMIHTEKITFIKVGKKYLINMDKLFEYLNNGGQTWNKAGNVRGEK